MLQNSLSVLIEDVCLDLDVGQEARFETWRSCCTNCPSSEEPTPAFCHLSPPSLPAPPPPPTLPAGSVPQRNPGRLSCSGPVRVVQRCSEFWRRLVHSWLEHCGCAVVYVCEPSAPTSPAPYSTCWPIDGMWIVTYKPSRAYILP